MALKSYILLLTFTIWVSHARTDAADFEKDIAPLFVQHCIECHNGTETASGLNLTTREGAVAGGEIGSSITDPPDENLMLLRIRSGEMPPAVKGKSQELPRQDIQLLEEWIAAGAPWPENRVLDIYEVTTATRGGRNWWSFQSIQRPVPPDVASPERVENSIDAFILARLESEHMQPAPLASKSMLLRRATYDLTGLPPTPEEMAGFLADRSPDAYEKVLDRLLNSPHFGERWARYWLDLVRFADTCGYERDQLKPNIWKYRDWVINALNSDMGYDQFVTDQIAGDEVTYRDEQSVIATGMIRAGTWNDEPNDPQDYLYTRLEDMVHATTSAFLGLTVKCARCHNHKFDPIPQTDYYRVAGLFWPGYIGQANLGGPSAEQIGHEAFGWTDRSNNAEPIHLLLKGERSRPSVAVPPGVLSAIPSLDKPFSAPPATSKTTHRRLQFAQWIMDPKNPLTARVLVNRLWQHHFGEALVRTPNNFGFKGVMPTHPQLLDWLAAELIAGDWKMKRIHKLLMMSTTYRQASVHPEYARYAQKDFTNQLWWRANRRRLDAEALRDSMLAISGQLQLQRGGPGFYPKMSSEALEGLSRKETAWPTSTLQQRSRRSIYMITKRSRLLPLMTTFDFATPTLPCGQRDVTIVATQALALLNNHFVHTQSEALALRITRLESNELPRQIHLLWNLVLARAPDAVELAQAVEHVQQQRSHFKEAPTPHETLSVDQLALASLCHVLLNTNEFIFID